MHRRTYDFKNEKVRGTVASWPGKRRGRLEAVGVGTPGNGDNLPERTRAFDENPLLRNELYRFRAARPGAPERVRPSGYGSRPQGRPPAGGGHNGSVADQARDSTFNRLDPTEADADASNQAKRSGGLGRMPRRGGFGLSMISAVGLEDGVLGVLG